MFNSLRQLMHSHLICACQSERVKRGETNIKNKQVFETEFLPPFCPSCQRNELTEETERETCHCGTRDAFKCYLSYFFCCVCYLHGGGCGTGGRGGAVCQRNIGDVQQLLFAEIRERDPHDLYGSGLDLNTIFIS